MDEDLGRNMPFLIYFLSHNVSYVNFCQRKALSLLLLRFERAEDEVDAELEVCTSRHRVRKSSALMRRTELDTKLRRSAYSAPSRR